MHCFKWCGVVLLLACGVAVGVTAAAYERRRYRQAEGFLALLRHVRGQIECFSTPLRGIFANCDDGIWADCGAVQVPRDLAALLRDVQLLVPQEICRLLHSLAERLGTGYREEQLRCCDYFLERLIPLCDKMRAELPKRERIALFLPMAAAAIAVLTLM